MRSYYLNVRILNERSQHRIIPSKYGSPIPIWGQNDAHHSPFTDSFAKEKLRRFCLQYPVGLATAPSLPPDSGWYNQPKRAIALIGMGTALGFSVLLSPGLVGNDQLVVLSANNSDTGGTQTPPDWLNSLGLDGTKTFTPQVAFAGISQARSSWVNPKHSQSPQFTLPVKGYPITSSYGDRLHPVFGDTRFHHGIDLGTPTGTPIRAAAAGYISCADWDGGYGKTIMIQHVGAYETLYAHLDRLQVKVGDRVKRGQIIGLSGSTGYVTGPHLHFEIRRNEVAYNPLDYF